MQKQDVKIILRDWIYENYEEGSFKEHKAWRYFEWFFGKRGEL